ncbi:MAG: MBL fold metallo-hydrolase, partial [Nitrospinae bacterium]|nr:MBL fold metallo-hydrolase [Nitrospinota bacterium]
MKEIDYTKPVQVSEHIYWVGTYDPHDKFQCNSYLILCNGKGVIVDSGSTLFLESLLEKVAQLVALDNIVAVVSQHQDPDVCGNIFQLKNILIEVGCQNLTLYTHFRTALLIKHYGRGLVFKHTDKLPAGKAEITSGFEMEFIHTPYLHAPGAITTYFPQDKVLLSSDLFGGVTENWSLYAGENYFEEITSFHKEYMPSKEILLYTIKRLESYDIEMIAPQHGSIMNRKQAQEVMKAFEDFNCGLFIEESFREELHEAQRLIEEQHGIMQQELEMAANFQKTLLPVNRVGLCDVCREDCPEVIDFSFYLKPCNEISGDFIIIDKIDHKHFGIMIIDVMGHGVTSGLATIEIKT